MKRVGRSDAYATEYDLEAEEYVPLPKGGPCCHAARRCSAELVVVPTALVVVALPSLS